MNETEPRRLHSDVIDQKKLSILIGLEKAANQSRAHLALIGRFLLSNQNWAFLFVETYRYIEVVTRFHFIVMIYLDKLQTKKLRDKHSTIGSIQNFVTPLGFLNSTPSSRSVRGFFCATSFLPLFFCFISA